MSIKVVIFVVVLGVLSVGMAGAKEAPVVPTLEAVETLRTAYSAMVQAELVFNAGEWTKAADLYEDAQIQFEELGHKYPGWQQMIIAARVADCRNQVDRARQHATSPETMLSTSYANVTPEEIRLRRLVNELRGARAWLAPEGLQNDGVARLKQSLALEALNSELSDKVKSLRMERDTLARQIGRIEKKYPFIKEEKNTTNLVAFPHVTEVLRDEARQRMRAGETDQSIKFLAEAVELLPQDDGLLAMLASTLCRMGQFRAALDLIPAGRSGQNRTTELILVRGTALLALGELGEARVELESALKADPKSPTAHYNMAQLLVALNPPEVEPAREHYALALQLGGYHDKNLEQVIREARIIEQIKKKR